MVLSGHLSLLCEEDVALSEVPLCCVEKVRLCQDSSLSSVEKVRLCQNFSLYCVKKVCHGQDSTLCYVENMWPCQDFSLCCAKKVSVRTQIESRMSGSVRTPRSAV
jgi:hypothetical protein